MTNDKAIPDIIPREAWNALSTNPDAVLVDVRTDVEWEQVGIPQLQTGNENLFFISWQLPPDMRINTAFLDDLDKAGVAKGKPIYFLCRSGVRSKAAAELATAAGYGPCYNVAEGFEGIAGADGVRHGGWRGNELPEAGPAKTNLGERIKR